MRLPTAGVSCLTDVDDFTKEAVDIVVDLGISGSYVARALDRAARFRGSTRAMRTDQGPEFTSCALDEWAYANGVTLKLMAGKSTQNAYIECINGKFRDERPNEHWSPRSFTLGLSSRPDVRTTTSKGRTVLNYLSP